MSSSPSLLTLRENLSVIQDRIAEAAQRAGRRPEDITLVGASKGVSPDMVIEAYRLGVRHFGENWVQEASPKIEAVSHELRGESSPNWHMIGHLQRNKVKQALGLFETIETLDNLRLAREMNKRAESLSLKVPVLIEVDFTDDPERSGYRLGEDETDQKRAEGLVREMEGIVALSHLEVLGLMTVGPMVRNAEDTRPIFSRLRRLRETLKGRFSQAVRHHLSMGMTQDYQVAIEEGATMVRIGSALFGLRAPGRSY